MDNFNGKVAVITGAASGIGLAIAKRCAHEGMKVVLADIHTERLSEVRRDLKSAGASVTTMTTDVAQASEVQLLADKTIDSFGAVHMVFNNAGVTSLGSVWESSIEDWERILGVNLWSVIHSLRAFVPVMLAQADECHIVNTASMSGLISPPGVGAYNVSKHGVVTLSETLHHELVQRGSKIRVSVLCPGIVNTRIMESHSHDTAPLAETLRQLVRDGMPPEDVADAVFNAIQQDRFYILTHPEGNSAIRARMDDILQGRTPTPLG